MGGDVGWAERQRVPRGCVTPVLHPCRVGRAPASPTRDLVTCSGNGDEAMETMTLEEVASYLQRDVREVTKLANRGYLPGQKVAGQWRFQKVEINHWIESQMHAYTEQELSALERNQGYETE